MIGRDAGYFPDLGDAFFWGRFEVMLSRGLGRVLSILRKTSSR